jgi:crotonobetainyl-CoA:carnitine CoA-transferase CaiB-like acyl-CoA transferase
MGADVLKLESADRPDQTPLAVRLLDQRLSGAKRKKQIKLLAPESLIELQKTIAESDVLITNARARALEPLGLTKERLFVANPNLIWIAITGHGYDSARIAFGDDAAASGGLVAWEGDEPRFMGDALADPLTGLSAANAALDALEQSGSLFIDMALARTAAYVAAFHP